MALRSIKINELKALATQGGAWHSLSLFHIQRLYLDVTE